MGVRVRVSMRWGNGELRGRVRIRDYPGKIRAHTGGVSLRGLRGQSSGNLEVSLVNSFSIKLHLTVHPFK